MTYTINRVISGAGIDDIDSRARKALADHGFGVRTESDVKAIKKKLVVEMPAVAGKVRHFLARTVEAT